jgi:ATP-dependent Lon protease
MAEIPDTIKNKIEIVPVKWIDKVLELALERAPVPLSDDAADVSAPPNATTPTGLIAH